MKFVIALALLLQIGVANATEKAEILLAEYDKLKTWVKTVDTDGTIGGLYPYVQMNGYIISFSESFDENHELIRLFKNQPAPAKDFAVTYIQSKYLSVAPGKLVLRRFVGHEPTGWRNDTVDVETKEDLGQQGARQLTLKEDEKAILDEWNITLF